MKKSINFPELRFAIDNGRTLCKECPCHTPNKQNTMTKNNIKRLKEMVRQIDGTQDTAKRNELIAFLLGYIEALS